MTACPMELSTNWKTLQKRIQEEKQSSNGTPKRKRPNDKGHFSHKRFKASDAKTTARLGDGNMGHVVSQQESRHLIPDGSSEKLQREVQDASNTSLARHNSTTSISSTTTKKYVSLDCEMVGVGPTPDVDSVLARVSVVNYHGVVLYDTFVLPPASVKVTDYRTAISGIRPEQLKLRKAQSGAIATNGRFATNGAATPYPAGKWSEDDREDHVNIKGQRLVTLGSVQEKLDELLTGRILIGHALKNDFHALFLSHPHASIRDTSRYPPFRALAGGRTPSLRKLAKHVLGRDIQVGEHSSVEDARAAMDLFKSVRKAWESGLRPYKGNGKKGPAKGRVPNAGFGKKDRLDDDDDGGVEDGNEDGGDGEEDEDELDEEDRARRERRKTRLKKKKKKGKKRTKRA